MARPVILLVGAGRMGSAMLQGWATELRPDTGFYVIDPGAEQTVQTVSAATGADIRHLPSDTRVDVKATAVILATKPQHISGVVRDIGRWIGKDTVVCSVAAGVAVQTIRDALDTPASVVRVMPNIGAVVGHSASAAFPRDGLSNSQRTLVETLFGAIGSLAWVKAEDDLHIVTALSGSGPAYYFAFCEEMIAVATAAGLSRDVAEELAIGTLSSAGRLIERDPDPAKWRETVTSPNGTTAAGLDGLHQGNRLSQSVELALQAAAHRSRALASG